MMIGSLTKGLIKVGSIISEAYFRNSNVSDEAKTAVGISLSEDVKGAIPIKPIAEYFTYSCYNMQSNQLAIMPLDVFGVPVNIESLYTYWSNNNDCEIKVFLPGVGQVISQRNFSNKTPYLFPPAPLPPEATLVLWASDAIPYFRLTFSPCNILDAQTVEPISSSEYTVWANNYPSS